MHPIQAVLASRYPKAAEGKDSRTVLDEMRRATNRKHKEESRKKLKAASEVGIPKSGEALRKLIEQVAVEMIRKGELPELISAVAARIDKLPEGTEATRLGVRRRCQAFRV